MADSDDEFDRRNAREKFRPERNDYERREERRPRETWEDREWAGRGGRRDGRRDRFSPPRHDGSPPQLKRIRREWEDGGFPHFELPYGALPAPPVAGPPPPPPPGWVGAGDVPPASFSVTQTAPRGPTAGDNELQTQPPMLSFKQFINSQDDNITDVEAVKKFGDYRTDFSKQQINEFFLLHKDEEWFRMKYHPEEYSKRIEEARAGLLKRCRVFSRLLELNRISSVVVDVDHSDDLVKLLDAAVILMEGGTEFDLKILDNDVDVGSGASSSAQNSGQAVNDNVIGDASKRDRPLSTSSADDDDKSPPRFTEPLKLETGSEEKVLDQAVVVKEEPELLPVKKEKKSRRNAGSGNESETGSLSSDSEDETANKQNGKESQVVSVATNNSDGLAFKQEPMDADKDDLEEGEERDEPKPRALHKTLSVFLRNLPAVVTKQEVEEMCKRYPGFIRVFLQDPQPERRFLRRGWVTFDHTVNVKEICWNLNNIRLRDCEVGAIVNRELKQRIRPVNGLTVHRPVAKQDLKHAATVIQVLDSRWNIWTSPDDEKKDKEKEISSFVSQNPVLKGIADYLVDEGSCEEQVLLGQEVQEPKMKENSTEVVIDKDESLLKVLDKLVLYLRIVYSLDYYSAIEYPNEDEMPHRCGIMHARGPLPPGRITHVEVNDWMSNFELRIMPFIDSKDSLTDVEMGRLGKKNPNDEVDKFILANTQELSKDKWLCPLSGKKFKGPDFVRKHILTKHTEKVDEVKHEVSYFNNFLKDAHRPQLPEHPTSKPATGTHPLPPPAAATREAFLPSFHGPLPPPPPSMGYRPPVMYQPGPAPFASRPAPDPFRGNDFRRDRFQPRRDNGPRAEPRRNYRDLDAPPDVEAS